MTPNASHVAGLRLALDRWNGGGPAIQYGTLLTELIEQAMSAPAESTVSLVNPVQGEAVEVVAWMKHELCTRLYFRAPPDPSIPLMTVAQHNRIVAALTAPPSPAEPVQGEAVGRFDGNFGGDVSGNMWFRVKCRGAIPKIGALIYTAPPSPDAELVELLSKLRQMVCATPENDLSRSGVWISTKHPVIECIDAKLASLRGESK